MADGEWRERRRGGERGRYLHARREQGVGVGGGTSTRRGIGQEVPISIFLAARTQHRGVIVAARRTQCCTQASRRAGVPDRGGIQGPGSLSPPKCSCSAAGGGGTYDPARQVALYSTWGRVPMAAAAPTSKAPHKLTDTDTDTHTHTHTPRDRVVCSAYLSTTRRSLNGDRSTQTTSSAPPGTPTRGRDSVYMACVCACVRCKRALPSPFLLRTCCCCNCLARAAEDRAPGPRKKQPSRARSDEPMPIANSTVNHTPAHSLKSPTQAHTRLASKTETGLDGWSGCSTARRYHNPQCLSLHTYSTVHSTHGLRTYCTCCRSTGHRAQWLFLPRKASRPAVCACARVCVCTGTQSVASFDFDPAYL